MSHLQKKFSKIMTIEILKKEDLDLVGFSKPWVLDLFFYNVAYAKLFIIC